MWELYRILEGGLPSQDEKYLLHEVIKILDGISTYNFKQALRILYGEEFYVGKNPMDFAVMFVKGIKQVEFFSFVEFIKGLRGNS